MALKLGMAFARKRRGQVVGGRRAGAAVACCGDGDGGRQVTGSAAAGPAGRRRCGLCWALVTRALRRAVCGAGSRRSSGESYQELQPAHHPEEDQVAAGSGRTVYKIPRNIIPDVEHQCQQRQLEPDNE
ncbi:uncharacterized protein LOC143198271 [Rhynchophorus ferrugineus]|uniref:uncharacterized protein LOC143198271 n=1 Tax=Rhynchophorus ferrugineus TaxID=354439 RepID=UPI003FCDC954